MKLIALTLSAVLALPAAAAQTAGSSVWRCGPEGRDYTDQPCAEGRQLAQTADIRSPEQVRQAQDAALRDQRLAASLVREREQREKRIAAQWVAPRAPVAARPVARTQTDNPAPRHKAKRRQPADDGIWRAVAPASRPAKG